MFSIIGTGHSLPEDWLSNADLATEFGASVAQITRRPGVHMRHRVKGETQISMALQAARAALLDASLHVDQIDLVIFASAVPYQPIPSTSSILVSALGLADGAVESLDLNTTCLSFLSALDKAIPLISAGYYRNVLIVSSEVASRGLPWQADPETAALFGDGAAAAVISSGQDKVCSRRFRTYASGWELCQLRSGGTREKYSPGSSGFTEGSVFAMRGRDLYRETLKTFPAFVDRLLLEAGWSVADIDVIIPHQASPHAISHMKKICGFSDEQLIETIQDTGNMISASIPYTLDIARRQDRIQPGSRVLMIGTSAGLALGGLAMELAP